MIAFWLPKFFGLVGAEFFIKLDDDAGAKAVVVVVGGELVFELLFDVGESVFVLKLNLLVCFLKKFILFSLTNLKLKKYLY